MQCMPQHGEGLILPFDVQGSQEKGLHPAPLGAAQHPPGRSHEPFPMEPSLACSTWPHCPGGRGRELPGAPHARRPGRGHLGVPTHSMSGPSLPRQPSAQTAQGQGPFHSRHG